MLLSEQVLNFHELCSHFIDNLQVHAKFHAKELLSQLQAHSEIDFDINADCNPL
jgi:hypothetical protein